jgi:hypothetical protein
MQALLIYMLLRLHQGETRYNDFDGVLLSTMWVRLSPLHLSLNVLYSCMMVN